VGVGAPRRSREARDSTRASTSPAFTLPLVAVERLRTVRVDADWAEVYVGELGDVKQPVLESVLESAAAPGMGRAGQRAGVC
jgi:hypothetical protein